MIKTGLLKLNLFLLLPVVALCQSAQRVSTALLPSGTGGQYAAIVPNATITVCQANVNNQCLTQLNIYADAQLTQPITQPARANTQGIYSYFIASGTSVVERVCNTYNQCSNYSVMVGPYGIGTGGGSVGPGANCAAGVYPSSTGNSINPAGITVDCATKNNLNVPLGLTSGISNNVIIADQQSDINTAVGSSLCSSGCMLQLTTTKALTGNLTVPAGITLSLGQNGVINCSGHSLTINGYVLAGSYQIFNSGCNVQFTNPQQVDAAWFSTTDWAVGLNGALSALPPSPNSKYAVAAGGSRVIANIYPSGSTTATTFNCNRAVQVVFGSGTFLSTVAPSIYATDPNCDIQGSGSGGQATGATIIRQTSGGLPVYRFQDSSAAFGAQGGGFRLEHIKLDGGDQSGNIIEVGTSSVPPTQRNIYSDITVIGGTVGFTVFASTGLPSGNPSPAQQIWLADYNCGTDSQNQHQVTTCIDLEHGPVIGMWVTHPNLNPLTTCAIIGPNHTSNAWLIQSFVMSDGICEPLGGLNSVGSQGSAIIVGDSNSVDIHGMYIESEGSPQLAPPLASVEIGTPEITDNTCSMSGSSTLTCTDAPFTADYVKDIIAVSACGISRASSATITGFTNSSTVTLSASGTCGPNATAIFGGGTAFKANIHDNEIYGYGVTTGMQYAFTVNNAGTFYPDIEDNYTVPTVALVNTTQTSSIGNLQNNTGCGTLATNAGTGWLTFECATGTGVPYIFTPKYYALVSPSGNISESWVIDGAGGQFTYVSGVSSCTNGTQSIAFTNGDGSGATAQVVVSGGVPTGAVQMTNFGSGYTVLPTQGTISTCTGTATFTGGRIVAELNPRYIRDVSGTEHWGPGTTATDVTFQRSGVGVLQVAGSLSVTALSSSGVAIVGSPGGTLVQASSPSQCTGHLFAKGIASTLGANCTQPASSDLVGGSAGQVMVNNSVGTPTEQTVTGDVSFTGAAATSVISVQGISTTGYVSGCYTYPCMVGKVAQTTFSNTTGVSATTIYTTPNDATTHEYQMCIPSVVTVAGSGGTFSPFPHFVWQGHTFGNTFTTITASSQWSINLSGTNTQCGEFDADANTAIQYGIAASSVTGTPTVAYSVTLKILQ